MAIELGSVNVAEFEDNSKILDVTEKIQTSYGLVKVSIYGDKSKHPIVTFHDIGLDADSSFQNFFQYGTVAKFFDKFCVYNINVPGQELDAKPFKENYVFPTMESMPSIVQSVVAHFNFKRFIGFGIGAGANVMLRYALENQNKLDALILINCTINSAGWVEWGYQKMNLSYLRSQKLTGFTVDYLLWHHLGIRQDEADIDLVRQYRSFFFNHPNPGNLASYIESFLNRSPISISRDGKTGPKLNIPVLQFVGSRSAFIDDTVNVNSKLDPANSDWVKIGDCSGIVLDDRPEKATEALLLFLQGLGYFPAVNVSQIVKRLQSYNNPSMTATTTICENINEVEAAF